MGSSQSTRFGKTSVYKKNEPTQEPTQQQTDEVVSIRPGYYKNSKGIFYDGINLNLSKREHSSFKKLKYSYAKTNKFVFYKGKIVEGADPKTFITINRINMPDEFKSFNSVIGMDFENDKKRIYKFGIKIMDI